MKTMHLLVAGLVLGLMACDGETSEDGGKSTSLTVKTLAQGLDHPWAMAFLPAGDILVTERSGALKRLSAEGKTLAEIGGVPNVDARGQGGLLDVALDPDFADNRYVYLTWSGAGEGGNATHLGRGRLEDNRLRDFETLFVATPFVDSSKHFGSRLSFDGDYLFMTVGDRGQRDRAQDLDDHNGSVLRLHHDGSVPDDNPFVGRDDARDAIYSYGHRNPQGAARHPESGRLWVHEHGPRGGDEINIPEAGANFGWPRATYGREYHGPEIAPDEHGQGLVGPIHQWTPSIAPSGMAFYTAERFPEWQGDLFVGALALTHLAHLELEGTRVVNEQEHLNDRGRRIRAVRQGPDGYLYLLTDQDNGRLVSVSPLEDGES